MGCSSARSEHEGLDFAFFSVFRRVVWDRTPSVFRWVVRLLAAVTSPWQRSVPLYNKRSGEKTTTPGCNCHSQPHVVACTQDPRACTCQVDWLQSSWSALS